MDDQVIEVPLTKGKVAIIDAADWPQVQRFRWTARRIYQVWYAITSDAQSIGLHRLLLSAPAGTQVDHIDGDGLNNRRSNLRFCTSSQNQQNRHHLTTNTSGFRGVTWHKQTGKWQAQIKLHGRNFYLGLFDDAEAAARAYDEKAREWFGAFARCNFAEVTA